MGSGLISWGIIFCILLVFLIAQDSRARKIAEVKEEARAYDDDDNHMNEDAHVVISIHHDGDDDDHHHHDPLHEDAHVPILSQRHAASATDDDDESYTDDHHVHKYAHPIISKHDEDDGDEPTHMDHDHKLHMKDPSLNLFFTIEDLKPGKTMPIYFSDNYNNTPSASPRLLSRQDSNSIPFSSSKLPLLLNFLSFSEDSPQAKAMKYTLQQCELKPTDGETKFCATSLESMLDFLRGTFGSDTSFKVLTTRISREKHTLFQNYTVLEPPKEIFAPKMIACHTMPYPYVVFYCHGQESGQFRLFEVLLGGENEEVVKAPAVCHVDTSQWDPDHVSFRVLKIKPGTCPVCHFFPADNLVWVPNN